MYILIRREKEIQTQIHIKTFFVTIHNTKKKCQLLYKNAVHGFFLLIPDINKHSVATVNTLLQSQRIINIINYSNS